MQTYTTREISLWGQVQHKEEIAVGVYWIGTAGHGGIKSTEARLKRLKVSPEAIAQGTKQGSYIYYEEDCQWQVLAYEMPELFDTGGRTQEQVKTEALKSLSYWNADYLLARGIEPEPEAYGHYKFREADQAMRTAKDPRLIVSASRITSDPDVCKVWTASNQEFLVSGYNPRIAGRHNLLEFCHNVIEITGQEV